jgi:hypothetical protein
MSGTFPWALDKRSVTAREVAADLLELWQDLGGAENLSVQQRWLCERVVYFRRRMLDYETTVLTGGKPTMDAGTYSNFANVCAGHLKSLGLERKARKLTDLRTHLATRSTTTVEAA